MKHISILVFLVGFFFLSAQSYADIFSWVDGNGVRHFSNAPPPQTVENVDKTNELEFDAEAHNKRVKQEEEQKESRSALELEEKSSKPERKKSKPRFRGKVEMYSSNRCGYCIKARNFFEQNNIRFLEHNIDHSKEAARKFRELNGRGVPLILIGEQRIAGFNEAALRDALGMK